ncbi:MAG: CoA pyrophosphatase [Acidimicrobiales bacterium]|nr:CoA pyrophosphatase [Acidimicrobiales bacterium]
MVLEASSRIAGHRPIAVDTFDHSLRTLIGGRIAAHRPRLLPTKGSKPAAVAVIAAADESGTPGVLLTRRSPRLKGHSGQWALPGGRIDAGETPLDTAIRETEEEVGLALTQADLLGRLDDYPTRSGYVISGFVFWVEDTSNLRANPSEVESIHHIPLSELTRADSPRVITIPETDRPVLQLPVFDGEIHAPTAALMYQFRLLGLDADHSPVAHFDQPVFAWR